MMPGESPELSPMSFVRKIHGSAVVAATLPGQRQMPFASRQKLDRLCDSRIRKLVRYAARSVPYYREIFAREGIDPREVRGARELDQLPLLDKQVVRERPQDFLADGMRDKSLSFQSSGTTGSATEICHDFPALWKNIAFGERERKVSTGQCEGGFRPKELYIGSEDSTFTRVIEFYQHSVLFPVRPRRRFIPVVESVERIAEIINAERPDILVGYGGWHDLFFRTVRARGIQLDHLPKMAMYIAEALPPGAREFIEGEFGIPVFSRYTAAECFKIGFFCPERSGFHIHEDLCRIRVVNEEGSELPHGEQGEVVLSNLVNRATVLLNYRMGDLAALLPGDSCVCGRTFKRMSEVEGRTEDILPLANGHVIHPRSIWRALKDEPEILQYQFIQHAYDRYTLKLVSSSQTGFPQLRRRAEAGLMELLGSNAHIDTEQHHDPLRREGQKYRIVISELARSQPN
jgi:phenylacetate-CoA ligase